MDLFNIKPITLLKGSHEDTGETGQGCFMNVIAYLNGEEAITDQSECVDPRIRPVAIWMNDYLVDYDRQRMLPFVWRAMGTAYSSREAKQRRERRIVDFWFAERAKLELRSLNATRQSIASNRYFVEFKQTNIGLLKAIDHDSARFNYVKDDAIRYIERAILTGCFSFETANALAHVYSAWLSRHRNMWIDSLFDLMEDLLPPADAPTQLVIERAAKLVEVAHGS